MSGCGGARDHDGVLILMWERRVTGNVRGGVTSINNSCKDPIHQTSNSSSCMSTFSFFPVLPNQSSLLRLLLLSLCTASGGIPQPPTLSLPHSLPPSVPASLTLILSSTPALARDSLSISPDRRTVRLWRSDDT